jgi:hypothetical protein
MTIESFNRQLQIGEKEREAVKWGWEQEIGNISLCMSTFGFCKRQRVSWTQAYCSNLSSSIGEK